MRTPCNICSGSEKRVVFSYTCTKLCTRHPEQKKDVSNSHATGMMKGLNIKSTLDKQNLFLGSSQLFCTGVWYPGFCHRLLSLLHTAPLTVDFSTTFEHQPAGHGHSLLPHKVRVHHFWAWNSVFPTGYQMVHYFVNRKPSNNPISYCIKYP